MAAAVRPTVAISIWRVEMMLSAVTMGFLALLGRLEVSGGRGVKVMFSKEAAPLDLSALPWRSSNLSNMSSSSRAVLMDLSRS